MTTISNIDLHCHTKASDGGLSPTEVVTRAYNRGINYLAITDHDLVAGVAEAVTAAQEGNARLLQDNPPDLRETFLDNPHTLLQVTLGGKELGVESVSRPVAERLLTVIPGVEFSTTWREEQIHVVGLFVDINHPQLVDLVQKLKIARTERAVAIGKKLERLGFVRPYERCCEEAQEGATITRGNFAHLIFADGKAKNVDDAFHKYLRRGQPAYVKTVWGSIEETIAVIKAAGGVAILAHPRRYHISNHRLRRLIGEFKAWGGESIEVSSCQQSEADRTYLTELCQQFEMYASLGSDFHHDNYYRDLGQNLDLPPILPAVWDCPQAKRWGLPDGIKQRLVHVTYHKKDEHSEAAAQDNTGAAADNAGTAASDNAAVTTNS